jgi:hypothetical protein
MKKLFYISAFAALAILGTMIACQDEVDNNNPQAPLSIADKDSVLVYTNSGGAKNIGVTATGEWTATAADNWLTATKRGEQTLRVEASANSGLVTRQTTITVSSGSASVAIKVRQTGTEADIIFDKAIYPLRARTDTARVLTISTVDYSIVIPDSSSWVSVIGAASGAPGEETKELLAAENITAGARTAIISFQQTGDTLVKRITLQQAAPGISLSVNSYPATAAGGSQEVTVTADVDYDITIPADAASWVSKTDVGNDKYNFTVSENTGDESRSASIVFKHRNGTFQRTFIITQNGASIPVSVGIKAINATSASNYGTSVPAYSIDGDLDVSCYFEGNGTNKEIVYELDHTQMANLQLSSITYYPRAGTGAQANGNVAAGKIHVSYTDAPATFVEVTDFTFAAPHNLPKTITLPPQSDVHSVKFEATSLVQGNAMSCREMVFTGEARNDISSKFVIADRNAVFAAAGGTDTINVATNCNAVTVSPSDGWCVANWDNGQVIVNVAAISSEGRSATVTVNGCGASTTFTVRQLGATKLDVTSATAMLNDGSTTACNGTGTSAYSCDQLALLWDGDTATSSDTHWESRYDAPYGSGIFSAGGGATYADFTFTLAAPANLSHIRLYQRNTNQRAVGYLLQYGNGKFDKIEIYTKSVGGSFVKQMDYDCLVKGLSVIVLPAIVTGVTEVQIRVLKSAVASGHVAMREVEFWGGL